MSGMSFEFLPVPMKLDHAELFDAGSVTFVVERRKLSDDVLVDAFGDDADALETVQALQRAEAAKHGDPELDVDFTAIHVLGSDGLEYLRFDCIPGATGVARGHYHLLTPHERRQVMFECDPGIDSGQVGWAFDRIRAELSEMLAAAGAPEESISFDDSLVEAALSKAEAAAQRA